MRFILLILLLASISAGLLDFKTKSKLRKTLARVKSRLDVEQLFRIKGRLNKYLKAPKLNVKRRALLGRRLREVGRVNYTTEVARYNTIEGINEQERMSELLYQGDIVLTEQQAEALTLEDADRRKRQATTNPYLKWPDRRLYFSFRYYERNEKLKAVARKAAKYYQDHTCIDFIENSTAPERVEIFEGNGCYSYLGNIHRVQELSLGRRCHTVGTAAHELAHALGVFHVQSRYDRDKYVIINVENIPEEGLKVDFKQETMETTNNLNVPYDYGSRMHYSATAFAIDSSIPTIVPTDKDHFDTMGSPFVAFSDLLLINRYYRCLGRCKKLKSAADCKRGFPNPRDCSKCICPGGYGGPLCDQRPGNCGKTLEATDEPQTFSYTLGHYGSAVNDYEMCTFWIKSAKKGRKVQIKIKDLYSQWIGPGCFTGGIEIKVQKDQRLTGYRYCQHSNVGKKFVSEVDLVPIIIYRDRGMVSAVLAYQML